MKTILSKVFTTIILIGLISLDMQGQSKEILLIQKEIDSLNKLFKTNKTSNAEKNHYYRLKKSESIHYYNGMLDSYLCLIDLHGAKRDRDSLMYYCNKFEFLEKQHPNKIMRIEYLGYKGQGLEIYWGLDEEALKFYFEAYELIKKTDNNIKQKTKIKKLIASIYSNKKQYDKALNLLLDQIKDTSVLSYQSKISYLNEIVNTYQSKNMPIKSNEFNNIMLKLSLKNKNKRWFLYSKVEAFENYYLMGNYKKAIDSGLAMEKKLLNNNSSAFLPIKLNNEENLAKAYQAIGDYKNAIFYLKRVISNGEMSDANIYIYDQLVTCYEKKNDLKLAIETYKKKNIVMDTVRARERKAFVDYYDNQVKTINIKEEAENIILKNEVMVAENKKQKLYISILLISLLTAGLLVGLFIVGKKYKVTKDKVDVLKKNEVNILKNHIKVRENELSAMLIAEAKKTEQLDQIKETLAEAIKNNDREQINLAQKSLNRYLKSSEEFGIFSERLESQYPGIVHQLKESHPELSQNDIRHCLLIKLGLSLKESAALLNITSGTVKNSRNRVIRKLELPEDVNFKQYLDQIEGNMAVMT
jgi:DNA-binding CsgD family transcriptional regulator